VGESYLKVTINSVKHRFVDAARFLGSKLPILAAPRRAAYDPGMGSSNFPSAGNGYLADLTVPGHLFRLFAEVYQLGNLAVAGA
jgi:hypothetical protein